MCLALSIMPPIKLLCTCLMKELVQRISPKNTDHTVSYLTHYLAGLPDFVRRVHLFLDNASSTNKNCFTMAWAMEMIQQGKLDFIRVSFMIPGHTKFVSDLLFSKIS